MGEMTECLRERVVGVVVHPSTEKVFQFVKIIIKKKTIILSLFNKASY